MIQRAILSLGLAGSRAPWAELGLEAPENCSWQHLPLGALDRWQARKEQIFEKVYLDLRSFAAVSEGFEAWKAALNALLLKLVHTEGQVPQLVGYTDSKDWSYGVIAVKLGVRELVTLDEIHGQLAASALASGPSTPSGDVIAFARRHNSPPVSTNPHTEELPGLLKQLSKHTIPFPIEGLEGTSLAIENIRATIRKAAPTNSSVLIVGPTGTGKERVAAALHRYSDRASKPFRVVDCAAVSPELFESEFFGHVAGAFTNALQDRKGLFELAHEGTLFIDQIHLLPLGQQAKLLRALQEKKFSPVGSEEVRSVDVRIITSSQVPLEELVHRGHFREDLYFRLRVIDIHLPALSERRGDIPTICESVLRKLAKEHKKHRLALSAGCIEKILLYEWPGNIRELRNALERACTLSWAEERSEIQVSDLPESIQFAVMKSYKTHALKEAVRRFEQEYIAQTLRRFGGSKEEAADALGLSLASLYRKLGS